MGAEYRAGEGRACPVPRRGVEGASVARGSTKDLPRRKRSRTRATEYVVAIDLGTSGLHCLLVDLEGHPAQSCYEDWTYETPPDAGSLGKEFNPDHLWRMVSKNVRKLISLSGVETRRIVGVSATSQREGMVFLDKAGVELYAGPNVDLRAVSEGLEIDAEFGPEVYSITGHAPSLLFVPARMRWFQANRPEVFDRIATVLTLSGWVNYKLCGQMASERCEGVELGLADVRHGRWSDRLQGMLGLRPGILPDAVCAGTRIGSVSKQAAEETGLPEGAAVVLAAPDAQCGLLAMNAMQDGQVGVVMGWSGPVQMVTAAPIVDPEGRTWTSCHPLPRRWILESNAGETGSAYRWLAEAVFGKDGESDIYGDMDRLAEKAPPGCEGALSFMGPTVMNVSRLGLNLGGLLFPVPLSAGAVQRSHLARAFLENLCFAIKANCQQLEAVSGVKISTLRIGGGLTRSQCLCRMLPQVLGMEVCVSEEAEVSGLGAAMCAAVGAGKYATLEQAMDAMRSPTRIVKPEPLAVMEYADHYERWSSARRWLDEASKELQ